MLIKFLSAIAIVFIAALLHSGCSAGKKTDDRFALKPGDSIFRYSIVTTDRQELPGNANQSSLTIQFMLRRLPAEDSLVHFQMTISRISITKPGMVMGKGQKGSIIVLPTGTMVTLTSDDSIPGKEVREAYREFYESTARILYKAKGSSLQVSLNQQGNLQEVIGAPNIIDRVARETGFDRRDVNTILNDMISTGAITDLINQLLFYVPGRKINKGDQWVKNITAIAKAPVKYSHLITAKELQGNEVQLSLQTVISARMSEEGTPYLEGNLSGEITADHSSGMPVSAQFTENSITHTNQYDVKKSRTVTIRRH